MKVLAVVGFIVVVTGFVIYALGSSMKPGDYDDFDAGVTGPLERGAVSRLKAPVNVWKLPRSTATRREREEMLVGVLKQGDEFAVLNHHQLGGTLWVQVVRTDDESVKGWICSPTADPVRATKVN